MAWRREATGWLVGLGMVLIGAGCVLPSRMGDVPPAAPTPPARDRQRAPELRISAPPAQPAASGPVAQASAVSATADTDPVARLHALHRLAAQEYAGLTSYIVRLRRREQVNGKDKPEEILLLKFRKQPFSVYFKWLGAEGKDREVVYVQGRYENKIHTRLAAGDALLMPAGQRIALAPDSPMVLSASRHPISEAGVGSLIDHLGTVLRAMDQGDSRTGTVRYLGPVRRPEFEAPCEAVEETIPPGRDPHLPHGGRRLLAFDPARHLPTLVITYDQAGHEAEYYCFDRWQYPVELDDDDFNPDKLWHR